MLWVCRFCWGKRSCGASLQPWKQLLLQHCTASRKQMPLFAGTAESEGGEGAFLGCFLELHMCGIAKEEERERGELFIIVRQKATYWVQWPQGLMVLCSEGKKQPNALQVSLRLAKTARLHLGLALRGRITIHIIWPKSFLWKAFHALEQPAVHWEMPGTRDKAAGWVNPGCAGPQGKTAVVWCCVLLQHLLLGIYPMVLQFRAQREQDFLCFWLFREGDGICPREV